MKFNRKTILFLIVILAALLACGPENIIPAPTAEPNTDAVATSVSATQTASAGGAPPATQPPAPPATQPPATQPPAPQPTQPPAPAVLRIVFTDGNTLKLWTEGVGLTNLYTGDKLEKVLLSDDGQVVAFTTVNNNWEFTGLWAAKTDGSSVQRLVDAPTMNTFNTHPSALAAVPSHWEFVPGTHMLAFNTRLTFEGPGLILQDDIRQLNMDNGALSTLLGVGQAGMFYYSPDGTQIALSTPTSISLINADGSNLRPDVLTYPAVITYSEYQWYSFPKWWPDSSQLNVVIPSADPMAPGASMTVWTIPTNNTPPFFLGTYTTDMALFGSDVLLSPDMSKVAYGQRVGPPANNNWDLRIAELNGASDVIAINGDIRFVAWSPDSSWYAFTDNQTYKVAQNGNPGVWPMADTPPARSMKWVDSARFIYLSGQSGSWDLRLGSFNAPSSQIGASSSQNILSYDFSN